MNEGAELIIIRKSYTPEEYPPIVEVCGKNIRDLSEQERKWLQAEMVNVGASAENIIKEVLDD